MNNTILIIIFCILLLPGLVGTILPVLPGIPYMFVIALIYGFFDKFHHLSWAGLLILATIAIASIAIDYLSGVLGARYGGASKYSYIWGMIGLIVGLFLFPPFGSIAGLFVGIFLGEYLQHNNQKKAAKAAGTGLLGHLLGMVMNLTLAVIFIILFIKISL